MSDILYEGVLILMELRGYKQVGQTSFVRDETHLNFKDRLSVADYALKHE